MPPPVIVLNLGWPLDFFLCGESRKWCTVHLKVVRWNGWKWVNSSFLKKKLVFHLGNMPSLTKTTNLLWRKKKEKELKKDSEPRRGNISNAFWGLVAHHFSEMPLCFQSVFLPPLFLSHPSKIKPTCFPRVFLMSTTPSPTQGREARSIYGRPLFPSHLLFPPDLHFYYADSSYSWKQL